MLILSYRPFRPQVLTKAGPKIIGIVYCLKLPSIQRVQPSINNCCWSLILMFCATSSLSMRALPTCTSLFRTMSSNILERICSLHGRKDSSSRFPIASETFLPRSPGIFTALYVTQAMPTTGGAIIHQALTENTVTAPMVASEVMIVSMMVL